MTRITPLNDRVLVKRTQVEQATASGIIIPDSAQKKTLYGTVLATGKGRVDAQGAHHPLSIKEGDTVLFGKYTGTEFSFDNEDLLILSENEILGVISK